MNVLIADVKCEPRAGPGGRGRRATTCPGPTPSAQERPAGGSRPTTALAWRSSSLRQRQRHTWRSPSASSNGVNPRQRLKLKLKNGGGTDPLPLLASLPANPAMALSCQPGRLGVQLSTLVVLQSTQSGGTFSTLVLRHSVVLVLGYSYSVVLSSTQLKP